MKNTFIDKINKKIKNKNGFISIETIISSVPFIMLLLLAIGLYTFIYPSIALEKQTHILAEKAKIQGGLTDSTSQPTNSDIDIFLNTMQSMGYDKSKVKIKAVTNPGNRNVIGVTPLGATGDNYVKRDSKQLIVITISVPSDTFLFGPLSFFKTSSSGLEDHTVTQSVLSERW